MNYVRVSTLIRRECIRFFRVYNQTILSPVINALIFYLIFTVAFSSKMENISNAPHNIIIAIGLVAMSILQAAYYNTQSTISIARMLGFIRDYTITPLKISEIFIGMVISSLVRAFCVGSLTFVILLFFIDIQVQSYGIVISLYYITLGAVLFASIGIIVGFISQDFDKAHAYTSYIITPLTMLSGTFYSATSLPYTWQNVVLANPIFYVIDGFRYGLTGIGENHSHFISMFGITTIVILVSVFAFLILKKNLQS